MQLCGSLSILWHCLSLGLEWNLTFSSPVVTAEFSKFAGILSAYVLVYCSLQSFDFTHCRNRMVALLRSSSYGIQIPFFIFPGIFNRPFTSDREQFIKYLSIRSLSEAPGLSFILSCPWHIDMRMRWWFLLLTPLSNMGYVIFHLYKWCYGTDLLQFFLIQHF